MKDYTTRFTLLAIATILVIPMVLWVSTSVGQKVKSNPSVSYLTIKVSKGIEFKIID